MIRSSTIVIVIFALFIVTVNPAPVLAQARLVDPPKAVASQSSKAKQPDYKEVLARANEKYKTESVEFDPVKIEREKSRQAAKKGMSTKEKTLWTVFAVGIAVLVVLLIKYGRDCKTSEPAGCTPGVDEFCTCTEYEPRN